MSGSAAAPPSRQAATVVGMHRVPLVLAAALLGLASANGLSAQDAAPGPFALVAQRRGQEAVRVPPRALAVIPERHTGRLIRFIDELDAIEPQFDDFARGMGLGGDSAIQLRTVEARIPVFVPKTEATISTLLQVPLGARMEIEGVLVERASRYLLLASDVRPTSRRRQGR